MDERCRRAGRTKRIRSGSEVDRKCAGFGTFRHVSVPKLVRHSSARFGHTPRTPRNSGPVSGESGLYPDTHGAGGAPRCGSGWARRTGTPTHTHRQRHTETGPDAGRSVTALRPTVTTVRPSRGPGLLRLLVVVTITKPRPRQAIKPRPAEGHFGRMPPAKQP